MFIHSVSNDSIETESSQFFQNKSIKTSIIKKSYTPSIMWVVSITIVLMMTITTTTTTYGWMTGSSVSSFGGSVLLLDRQSSSQCIRKPTFTAEITMKKGKDNVPPSMRTQYTRQKEMVAMRDQMLAASKPGSDGFPVFNLFVRTKRANVRIVHIILCFCSSLFLVTY